MNISYMAIPGLPTAPFSFMVPKEKKIDIIKEVVSDHFSVSSDQLMSKSRKRESADARHAVYYFLNQILDVGPVDTGKMFKIDHTTAINGREKIKGLTKVDTAFRMEMEALKKSIENGFNAYGQILLEEKNNLVESK